MPRSLYFKGKVAKEGYEVLNPVEEIYFWSGIMRDHGEFLITALSSREPESINTANTFKNEFARLREEAQMALYSGAAVSVPTLVSRAMAVLTDFVTFKRIVLRRLLQCDIEINLTPTFINHMINEAMEFHRAICLSTSPVPVNWTAENIQLHKIWLPDAAGHAASIAADLDPTETALIKEAEEFKNAFNHLFIKADELGKMLERACLADGSLTGLNEQVKKKMQEFIHYLEKVKKLRVECKALGVLKPLVPDHMLREEMYFLTRLKKAEV